MNRTKEKRQLTWLMALDKKMQNVKKASRRTQVQRYQDAPDTKKKSGVKIWGDEQWIYIYIY